MCWVPQLQAIPALFDLHFPFLLALFHLVRDMGLESDCE